jgi:hypothetical protein
MPDGHPTGGCSEASHHPENGGYYIEGVNGVDKTQRESETGKIADNTLWAPGVYYPHMELKLCEGPYCSEADRVNGTEQSIATHTCSLLRFTYDPPSNVYEMADREHFENCDFTGATLRGASDAGQPSYDYVIEADHEKSIYYFASNPGCADGQKVAFNVMEDYAKNAAQCKSMALGSSRIQNCDCNHDFKETTVVEPCFSNFRQGCLEDMPDDLSCCNPKTEYKDGVFKNCGTCIPKSKEAEMLQTVADTLALNEDKKNEYAALDKCPSRYSGAYDAKCDMWKAIKACLGATGEALEECNCDMSWVVYQKHVETPTPTKAPTKGPQVNVDASGSSFLKLGILIEIACVLALTL